MQPGDIAAFNADGKLIPAVVMAINEDGTLDLSVLPVNYRKVQVSEDPKASGTVFLPTVYGYDHIHIDPPVNPGPLPPSAALPVPVQLIPSNQQDVNTGNASATQLPSLLDVAESVRKSVMGDPPPSDP